MNFSEAMYSLCGLLGQLYRATLEEQPGRWRINRDILFLLEEEPLKDKTTGCELCGAETPCASLKAHPEAYILEFPRLICPECEHILAVGEADDHQEPDHNQEQDEEDWDYYSDDRSEEPDWPEEPDDFTLYDNEPPPCCPCGDEDCPQTCGVLPCGCIDVHKEWKHVMRAQLGCH